MESDNGLIQRISRIIRQHTLEVTERNRTLIEMLRLLHHVIAGSVRNELVRTPVFPVRIPVIGLPVISRDYVQRLPLRIPAILNDLFPQVGRNPHDIRHQFLRLLKYILIHLLQDDLDISHAGNLERQKIGIIDMPVSIGTASHKSSVKLKIPNRFRNLYW